MKKLLYILLFMYSCSSKDANKEVLKESLDFHLKQTTYYYDKANYFNDRYKTNLSYIDSANFYINLAKYHINAADSLYIELNR